MNSQAWFGVPREARSSELDSAGRARASAIPPVCRRFLVSWAAALLLSAGAFVAAPAAPAAAAGGRPVAVAATPVVSAGGRHTCGLLGDGSVKCWGGNEYGQLGNNSTSNSAALVAVSGISGASAISAGGWHTCALLANGTVDCWGLNHSGQLGNDSTSDSHVPVAVSGLSGAIAISAGESFSCALLANGTVACWGSNYTGQLGTNDQEHHTPQVVPGLSGVKAISAGGARLCALLKDGTVACSGEITHVPAVVAGISGATAIATGGWHACALLVGGTVDCWAYNDHGQLGNGSTDTSETPVAVLGLSGATAVAAGLLHSCALLTTGTVECWGDNVSGELGNGSTNDSHVPVAVSGLSGATAISDGWYHTCALLANGTADCWGDNGWGELGNTGGTHSETPVAVSGLKGTPLATAISSGGGYSCALLAKGTADCWGFNGSGRLGNNSTSDSHIPVAVSGLSGAGAASAISAGGGHACALMPSNTVQCWGWNIYGELGDDDTTDSHVPMAVSGLSGAISVSAGAVHTCAVLVGGTVKCWGHNNHGQLGNDSTSDSHMPVAVSGLSGAIAVAAGDDFTCALLANGTVDCWGHNSDGQIGNNSTSDSHVPVAVSGLSGATAIATGDGHACARLAGGTILCWGWNWWGQLGNNSTSDSLVPVPVSGLSGAVAVSGGVHHTCALLAGGTVDCWGDNYHGQLGNASNNESHIPVAVSGLSNVTAVSAGHIHTCARLASGTVDCWGSGAEGELGNDGTSDSTTPVPVTAFGGATYVSLTPNRLVDSRPGTTQTGLTGKLRANTPVSFQVSGRVLGDATKNVPAGAVAVTGNLTVVGQTAKGWIGLTPTNPGGAPGTSTLNFPYGDIRANGVTAPLGPGGVLWITYVAGAGNTSDVVFDVTGYFTNDGSGATYVSLTPNRLVDSRPGAGQTGLTGKLHANIPVSFQVSGRVPGDPTKNVPASAVAVTGNLTVVGQSAQGWLGLTPTNPGGPPGTSTLNFPRTDIRANGVTAPLGPGGVMWVTYGAGAGNTSDVVFDVTGYFTNDDSGATYVSLAPNRLVDSRPGAGQTGLTGKLHANTPVSFQVSGRVPGDATKNVPASAVAVTGNLTVVGQTAQGWLGLTPTNPGGPPGTSTLNFPYGDIRANGITAPLGPGGVMWVTYAAGAGNTSDVVLDVTGYFVN